MAKTIDINTREVVDNVVELNTITTLDIPAQRIIDALPDDMEDIVIVGYDSDGELILASNKASGGDVLWLIKSAEKLMMEYM